jgi:hypothetical protein
MQTGRGGRADQVEPDFVNLSQLSFSRVERSSQATSVGLGLQHGCFDCRDVFCFREGVEAEAIALLAHGFDATPLAQTGLL